MQLVFSDVGDDEPFAEVDLPLNDEPNIRPLMARFLIVLLPLLFASFRRSSSFAQLTLEVRFSELMNCMFAVVGCSFGLTLLSSFVLFRRRYFLDDDERDDDDEEEDDEEDDDDDELTTTLSSRSFELFNCAISLDSSELASVPFRPMRWWLW